MLKPPKGDWIGMLELANASGSMDSLLNVLNVLNMYGDDWETVERTEIVVYSVDVENRDIEAAVNWDNPNGKMEHGRLSFENAGKTGENTLYRWVTRQ